jgi:hypothetical protein
MAKAWNPYKAYSRKKKYMALIKRLQGQGYRWLMGALHSYYLMPPLPENATIERRAFDMGAPYCSTDKRIDMSFIHAEGIEEDVAVVMREIYG